jgi:valyl-tRNA synthetase
MKFCREWWVSLLSLLRISCVKDVLDYWISSSLGALEAFGFGWMLSFFFPFPSHHLLLRFLF